MLGFIRNSMKGWIAWAIIGLLIIPFALWGINEYFGDGGGPLVVATVNGETISQQSYRQAFNNQRDRMRQMLGGQYNPDMFDKRLKEQALQDLIERELLFQEAISEGFVVADTNVREYIQNVESFQEDGRFSKEQYTRILRSNGETPIGFENRIQRGILTQQLYSGLVNSSIATEKDIAYVLGLEEQSRKVSYLTLPLANFLSKETLPDEELKKYYNENLQKYMTEEQVSIEYIELDGKKLTADEKPTEEQLQAYFKERSAQYTSTAERKTSHILIAVEEGADEKTVEAAKKKAKGIKARLDKGESFKALAEKYSEDPGSSKLGGDIGFFGKDSLDPNYEKAMFSMQAGDISEPVLTAFGFHIIRLDEVREPEVKSFADVRDELAAEYSKTAIDKKYYDLAEKITNLAYENTDTLEDAAGAAGIEIQTSGLFTRRGGPGIASNPKITAAAFSDDVLNQAYNSEAVELGENHIVILRVKDHKEKSQKSLEDVKLVVNTTLQNEKAKKAVLEAGKSDVEKLQADNSDGVRQQIATELKLEWKQEDALKRKDSKLSAQVMTAIFKANHPVDDKPVIKGLQLANGDYVIFSLAKVSEGKLADNDAAKQKTIKNRITGVYGEEDFSQFVSDIKQSAKINIRKNNI